jgi:hypothetical protein
MNPTTTHNYDEARRYSTAIADEIKALELCLTLNPHDENDADDLAAALDTLELNHVQPDEALATYLNETALEITLYRATDDDDEPSTRVAILRTCGGPRCEITRENNDGQQIEVTTYVLDECYTYRVTAPNLAAQLDEMAYYQ